MYHSFDAELAQALGVAEAILLHHMQYWIAKNEANGVHFYDGRTWTYNSVRAYGRLFPYFSERQLANALKHLEAEGILVTGHYSDNPRNRTLWYAFSDAAAAIMQKCKMQCAKNADCILQNCEMQYAEMSNALGENVKCTYSTGNNITGNDVTGNNQEILKDDDDAGAPAREDGTGEPEAAADADEVNLFYRLWHRYFGTRPTIQAARQVCEYADRYAMRDPPMMDAAIKLTAQRMPAAPVEFIRRLFEDWRAHGITTPEGVEAHIEARRSQAKQAREDKNRNPALNYAQRDDDYYEHFFENNDWARELADYLADHDKPTPEASTA